MNFRKRDRLTMLNQPLSGKKIICREKGINKMIYLVESSSPLDTDTDLYILMIAIQTCLM